MYNVHFTELKKISPRSAHCLIFLHLSPSEYIDLICGVLDIPVYNNRIQSLHVLFTLYSEFKNSQHFNQLAKDNQLSNDLKNNRLYEDGNLYEEKEGTQGSESISFD